MKSVKQHVRELERTIKNLPASEYTDAFEAECKRRGVEYIFIANYDKRILQSFFQVTGVSEDDYCFKIDGKNKYSSILIVRTKKIAIKPARQTEIARHKNDTK